MEMEDSTKQQILIPEENTNREDSELSIKLVIVFLLNILILNGCLVGYIYSIILIHEHKGKFRGRNSNVKMALWLHIINVISMVIIAITIAIYVSSLLLIAISN